MRQLYCNLPAAKLADRFAKLYFSLVYLHTGNLRKLAGDIGGGDGARCRDVDCSGISFSGCPASENLSEGQDGLISPEYAQTDMRVRDPQSGETIGCFSACERFTAGTAFGGAALSSSDPKAVMYCCPTPPMTRAACETKPDGNPGPVLGTQYAQYIKSTCSNRAYYWAFHDEDVLNTCLSDKSYKVVFGPNCP